MPAIVAPLPQFADLDGKPLHSGAIFIGAPNLNPETSPVDVFWDAALTQPAQQPLRTSVGSIVRNGTTAQVYTAGDYSMLVKNVAGAQVLYARTAEDFSVGLGITQLRTDLADAATGGLGDALLGTMNTATGGIARTQHDRNQEDIRSTDFSTLQLAATAAATAGLPLRVIGNHAMGSTKLTLPVGFTDLILEGGATLTWTGKPAVAAGTFEGNPVYAGIEALGDNVTISGNGRIIGPSTATYVANEAAIFRAGASSASRGIGLTVKDRVRVSNWGAYGVLTAFCDGITLEGDYKISGVGYGGALLSSASMVRVRGGEIGGITPGTIGNAYGLTLSHNSTAYAGGGKAAAQPFCWDVVINGLTVYDVPIWQAIDAHGAYEVSITDCHTYNCRFGIAVSGGSGAAANYAGYNNHVIGNTITVNKRDGSATTVATDFRLGINISGGATSLHDGIVCAQNIIDGYGDTTPSGASISSQYVRNAQIVNNTIKNWTGRGIYTAYGGGVCQGNIFDAVSSATNTTALYFDTTLDTWTITGNRHRPLSGTVAAEGLRFASGNPRCLVADNDLDAATTPYASFTGANTLGASDTTPQITVTGTPTTISVAAAGRAPRVWVNLDTSGISTVATITGAFVGQRITLYASTTNVTTVDRTQMALAGGANWASTQYDVLELLCVSTSATIRYVQVGAAANS